MADASEIRQLDIDSLVLGKGSHESPERGLCVLEAVAFVAGEPHSDSPDCASRVIGAFMRRWNDDLDDATRQRLKPYIWKLVGTRASAEVEDARSWLAADWLVRTHTAAWLDLAGLTEQAEALRALPELRDLATLNGSRPTLDEARKKAATARAAAWDAAGDAAARAAARAAAWDAAGDAAWAAAGDAAAGDAAWAAARAAAWDAARAAAWKTIEPTRVSLQESAFVLLDKMIALGGLK